jgi:uncharacterized protein YndB with AHSA1/START domain
VAHGTSGFAVDNLSINSVVSCRVTQSLGVNIHGREIQLMANTSTRVSQHVNASRQSVYRALLNADAVAIWMEPKGMTSNVHVFDPREGGPFRISVTYETPHGTGKTTAHTDMYHGRFVKLVPNKQVVEVVEFETADSEIRGEMTVTFTLTDADDGTSVFAVHDKALLEKMQEMDFISRKRCCRLLRSLSPTCICGHKTRRLLQTSTS